jgi:hypothetical protein
LFLVVFIFGLSSIICLISFVDLLNKDLSLLNNNYLAEIEMIKKEFCEYANQAQQIVIFIKE